VKTLGYAVLNLRPQIDRLALVDGLLVGRSGICDRIQSIDQLPNELFDRRIGARKMIIFCVCESLVPKPCKAYNAASNNV
jgi:hypothetical protein